MPKKTPRRSTVKKRWRNTDILSINAIKHLNVANETEKLNFKLHLILIHFSLNTYLSLLITMLHSSDWENGQDKIRLLQSLLCTKHKHSGDKWELPGNSQYKHWSTHSQNISEPNEFHQLCTLEEQTRSRAEEKRRSYQGKMHYREGNEWTLFGEKWSPSHGLASPGMLETYLAPLL